MNPYLIIAALVAVALSGAGGFKLGVDHEIASQRREDEHISQAVDAANNAAAQAISTLKPVYTTIQGKVIRETATNNVYRDCHITASGMQYVQQALGGGVAPSDSKLPKAESIE